MTHFSLATLKIHSLALTVNREFQTIIFSNVLSPLPPPSSEIHIMYMLVPWWCPIGPSSGHFSSFFFFLLCFFLCFMIFCFCWKLNVLKIVSGTVGNQIFSVPSVCCCFLGSYSHPALFGLVTFPNYFCNNCIPCSVWSTRSLFH